MIIHIYIYFSPSGNRDSAESDPASRKNSQSKFFVPKPEDNATSEKDKEETTITEEVRNREGLLQILPNYRVIHLVS